MGKIVKDIQEREKGKRKGKDIVVMYYIHLFCPLLVYHESLGSKWTSDEIVSKEHNFLANM